MTKSVKLRTAFACCAVIALIGQAANGQTFNGGQSTQELQQSTSALLQGKDDGLSKRIQFAAEYQIEEGKSSGVVLLTVNVADQNYIYSLTQIKDGPPASKITMGDSAVFKLSKEFIPDQKPKVSDPNADSRAEKHEGKIVFWAPIVLDPNQDLTQVKMDLRFNGTVCSMSGSCQMIRDKEIEVKFGGYYRPKTD